jgi:hypothetical protein
MNSLFQKDELSEDRLIFFWKSLLTCSRTLTVSSFGFLSGFRFEFMISRFKAQHGDQIAIQIYVKLLKNPI